MNLLKSKIVIVILLLLVSCNRNSNITQPETNDSKITKLINSYFTNDISDLDISRAVKINSTIPLNFISNNIPLNQIKCKSSVGLNKIEKKDSKIYLKTTNDIGITTIIFPNMVNNKNSIDSVHILVYKQFIILKADDLIFQENLISSRWLKFIKYCVENDIKASIGLIGNSLEKGNADYFNYVKQLIKSNYFEIWNHGYNHIVKAKDSAGNVFSEFWNSSYEYQKFALEKTQNLCREKLNYYPKAFGAPGNAIDNITLNVINENEDIIIWLYGLKNTNKFLIKRSAEIEFPYGHPIYEKFINNYLPKEKLLTFQIHPNMWDDEKFNIFTKIIEFLESQNVTFLTPSEYYFLSSTRK